MPAIIFDVDGTLTQSNDHDADAFVRAVRDVLGLERVSTDWSTYEHSTDQAIAEELARRAGRNDVDAAADEVRERFLDVLGELLDERGLEPVFGAAVLLESLRTEGWPVAIATGAWDESACMKLHAAGIDVDGVPMATASDARERPAIIRLAAERAGVDLGAGGASCVYVGDGIWDVKAAATLGIGFLGVAEDPVSAERLMVGGAGEIVPSFDDVVTAMDLLRDAAALRG